MSRLLASLSMMIAILLSLLLFPGSSGAAGNEELFKVDQKAVEDQIDNDMGKVENFLLQNNLREILFRKSA